MSDDASGTGGPLVLVIEDDRGVRELMVDILSAEGFQVRTAGDGLEGLLKLQVLHPAALVLDIMMPDVGGLRSSTSWPPSTPRSRTSW